MVATAAAEQCHRGTEDLPSQPTGCRVQSISTERKVVGLPPISLLPQKLIKGIIPAVERFHTLWVPKKINTTVSVASSLGHALSKVFPAGQNCQNKQETFLFLWLLLRKASSPISENLSRFYVFLFNSSSLLSLLKHFSTCEFLLFSYLP